LLERVKDPGTTVEMTIEGRGLMFGCAAFFVLACLAVNVDGPPRWLAIVVMTAIVVSTLRGARWSPFFAGPYLTLSPTEFKGRGGMLQPTWTLRWDQIDRFGWGRYGLFVYRRGAETWRAPYMQGGVGGPRLVAALSARLDAYLRCHTGEGPAEIDNRSSTDHPR
jgi:hypothetical protein